MTNWSDMTVHQRDELMRRYMAEGEDAFTKCSGVAQCPHKNDSQEATWWRRGFGNAKLGSLIGNKR